MDNRNNPSDRPLSNVEMFRQLTRSSVLAADPPTKSTVNKSNAHINAAFDKLKITAIAEKTAALFDPTASALESARLSSRILLNAGGQRRPIGRSCRRA